MFGIGDLARHGRVSVRMLRHYDAIGLLPPARVDPSTGYRSYEAAQLAELNRIVALKDLGFSLDQIKSIVDSKVGIEELRGMLRLRRAQLQTQIADDTLRLSQVELRLRLIEREGIMPTDDVQVKPVPAVRVAELTALVANYEPASIGPVIGALYDTLCTRLDRAGVARTGPCIAHYEDAPDGEGIVIHAAAPIGPDVTPAAGWDFAIVDLPAIERAATIVHRGSMDDVLATEQTLAAWFEANGLRSGGYSRELYLEGGEDRTRWVTELQEPIKE